jgi:hypothetical protein
MVSISDDVLPLKNVVDGERGGDNTVEALSVINSLTDEEGAHIFNIL